MYRRTSSTHTRTHTFGTVPLFGTEWHKHLSSLGACCRQLRKSQSTEIEIVHAQFYEQFDNIAFPLVQCGSQTCITSP